MKDSTFPLQVLGLLRASTSLWAFRCNPSRAPRINQSLKNQYTIQINCSINVVSVSIAYAGFKYIDCFMCVERK
jgi:hypothetical protein